MSRLFKFTLLFTLILFSLACGLISNPLNQAKGLASTAEAMATSMPVSTLEALSSSMPNFSQYLNPTGTPVSNWNNIPIMPQATAGQEFNKTTYSFKANSTPTDVQNFYADQLKSLGWASSFSAQGGGQGGVMLFTKDSNILTITITSSDKGVVVLLNLQ